jgi:eukaryotic-like serine/threonine-protein kinase
MSADSRLLADRYRLLSVVARGGMGQVWEASDELLGRTVAIKEVRFPTDVPEEERAVMGERTMREAKLTARLAHRGIITIYDVICVDDRPFIVMELVRAPSLARQVDEHGPLPPAEVAEIGLQLLDALAVAHGQGILHRDVKPSNVLLAPDRVVLTDFGIATSESDATLTSTGLLVGSPTYMSPERLRGGDVGPAADLWSLGATLYAALEGQPPFRSTTTMGTITAVLVDNPEPVHVGGPLGAAVIGMLDKDVRTRLTGAEAAELLQASLRQESPLAAVPPAAPGEPSELQHQPLMAPMVTWQNPVHLDDDDLGHLDQGGEFQPQPPSRSFSFIAPAPGSTAVPPGYEPPGYEGQGYHDGEGAGGDDSRSSTRRRTGLLALTTVLVAAALTAILLTLTRNGGSASPSAGQVSGSSGTSHHHRGTGSSGASAGQNSPSGAPHTKGSATSSTTLPTPAPTSGLSTKRPTSAPTSPSSPTGASTAAGAAGPVPAGYQLMHDPLGFQVAVPTGWTRRSNGGSRVDYVSPTNSAMYLRVDQTPHAAPSALQAWRDYEPTLARQLPGFHLLRLESVPFRQWQAADMEFTWRSTNTTLHVLDRGFITNPRGFALLMSAPDDTWQSQALPVFNVAGSTFSPTP